MTKEERNHFIETNTKLVASRVYTLEPDAFKDPDYYNDLFQAGMVGFIEGMDKFKEDMGASETTYCVSWIDCRIKEFKRKNRMIIIPSDKYYKVVKIKHYHDELLYSEKEIMNLMNLDLDSTRMYCSLGKLLSMNSVCNEEARDNKYENLPEYVLLKKEQMTILHQAISKLTDTEQFIIKSIFGIDEDEVSMHDIAKKFNVTRQYIWKVKSKVIKKLQNYIFDEYYILNS